MAVLYNDPIDVHYGFIFLDADADSGDLLTEARKGQANGLLGARIPHVLSMVTGLHTGDLPFVVEWHESEPEVDQTWDDIVEASFEVPQAAMILSAFEVFEDLELPSDRLASSPILGPPNGRGLGDGHARRRRGGPGLLPTRSLAIVATHIRPDRKGQQ